MSDIVATALNVGIGCIGANFLWQLLHGRDWGSAFERSFFQVFALGLFLLTAHSQGLA